MNLRNAYLRLMSAGLTHAEALDALKDSKRRILTELPDNSYLTYDHDGWHVSK